MVWDLLRPHRGVLALAFLAVVGEAGTDLLEPWPLKIVFDYVFGTKHLPSWMTELLGPTLGLSKVGILHFAIVTVIVIAVAGAVSAYAEKYLTTSVGEWVMHDLRRVLYHHIQRLSLAYHDHKLTGDLISTVTADIDAIQDFISQALLGILVNVLTLAGMLLVMFYLNWRFTLVALAKKMSVAGTIMEPVNLVPVTLETQGRSPSLDIQPCVYEEGL